MFNYMFNISRPQEMFRIDKFYTRQLWKNTGPSQKQQQFGLQI